MKKVEININVNEHRASVLPLHYRADVCPMTRLALPLVHFIADTDLHTCAALRTSGIKRKHYTSYHSTIRLKSHSPVVTSMRSNRLNSPVSKDMLLTLVLRCTSCFCFGNRSIVKPGTQYETAGANLRVNRVSHVDSGLRIRIEVLTCILSRNRSPFMHVTNWFNKMIFMNNTFLLCT